MVKTEELLPRTIVTTRLAQKQLTQRKDEEERACLPVSGGREEEKKKRESLLSRTGESSVECRECLMWEDEEETRARRLEGRGTAPDIRQRTAGKGDREREQKNKLLVLHPSSLPLMILFGSKKTTEEKRKKEKRSEEGEKDREAGEREKKDLPATRCLKEQKWRRKRSEPPCYVHLEPEETAGAKDLPAEAFSSDILRDLTLERSSSSIPRGNAKHTTTKEKEEKETVSADSPSSFLTEISRWWSKA